jgi:uncharacterized protein
MSLYAFFFDRATQYAYYCAPMAMTLIPDYVDARKIFAQHAHIKGNMHIIAFARFCEGLVDSSGNALVELEFYLDEKYRRIIAGRLEANVNVLCQRCLEPTEISLNESFRLAMVETDEQAENLPTDLDPWLCNDSRLRLADIIEEQLILSMPIVSYHKNDCIEHIDNALAKSKQSKSNPFEMLKILKDSKPH